MNQEQEVISTWHTSYEVLMLIVSYFESDILPNSLHCHGIRVDSDVCVGYIWLGLHAVYEPDYPNDSHSIM